ncbi:MAG TPA: GDSL-type esterase/lipase family protein [Armatimonadota bacterium]
MSAPRFDALIAVGDNLCIDSASVGAHRGPASLLYRNRDAEWPEFHGRDMVTRDPAARLLIFGQDGATAKTTLSHQMKRVGNADDPVLVTVTAGAKDLLKMGDCVGDADQLYEALVAVFDELGRRLAEAYFMLGNIPDPGAGDDVSATLVEYNAAIADVAREQGASLIDICSHFEGHGPKSGEDAWLTPVLDPTPEGAHQIRTLFWQALMEF